MDFNEIETLLRQNRLSEAIHKLSALPAYHQEALLLGRRLTELRERQRQQMMTDQEASVGLNKIAGSILETISSVTTESGSSKAPEREDPQTPESRDDYDIFISFAEVDDLARHGAKEGWVTTLIRELRGGLAQSSGRNDVKIWSPHQLRGNLRKQEEILDKQRRSATFIVVLSRGYLKSDWCKDPQLDFFDRMKTLVPAGRVFLVERERLDAELRPEAFHELQGYEFWIEDRIGRPPRTLGDPTPQRDADLYYERLRDLCYDLAQKLKE